MDINHSKAHLVPEQTFDNWTVAWKNLEFDPNPFEFFKSEEGLIAGVVFDSHNISSLLSTTGVSTIKIRFGFNAETKDFEIILFGTDSTGQVLTPYYVPAKKLYQKPDASPADEGKVPSELIKQWKNNWLVKAGKGIIDTKNFMTPYGFTRGYNYPLKEFIETLFTFSTAPDINIVFVLHEYYGINYLITKEKTFTFGVVLQGKKASSGDSVEEDPDSYYDLTAPCPRTC